MLRERDHPAPPAPLDLDSMLIAACSELEVTESDRLFFCGEGQSRLANQARATCAGCEVQGVASSSLFAILNRPSMECGVDHVGTTPEAADCLGKRAANVQQKVATLSIRVHPCPPVKGT
jgi:hypothetical protein